MRSNLRRRFARRRFLLIIAAPAALALGACATSSAPAPTAQQPAPTQSAVKSVATAARAPTAAPKPTSPAAQPTAAPTPAQITKVRVGLAPPRSVNQAMPYIGVERGFYRAVGVEPEFVEIQASPQVIKSLISGELDVVDTGTSGVLAAVVNGASMKQLGSLSKRLHTAIFVKNDINSLRDMYGRTIAITGVGTLPHTVAQVLMRQENLDPGQVNFIATGDQNTFLSLVAGKVDGNVSSIDDLPEAEKNPDIKMLLVAGERLPSYIRTSIVVRDDYLTDRRDLVTRFVTAYTQSHRYAMDHKDEIVALSTKLNKREPNTNALVFDVFRDRKLMELDLTLTPADLDYMQDINILTGQQKEKVPSERLLDLDVRSKALAQLGPYKPAA